MAEPEDTMPMSSAEQYGALAHPLRLKLLVALGEQPATISQLAVEIGTRKGNVAHHLKVLRDAGLVRVGFTRQVRGGTEQYYERTARRYNLTGSGANEPSAVAMGVIADEIAASPTEAHLVLRHLRLTTAQVEALTAHLTTLVQELAEASTQESRYGVAVSVWQRPDPGHT